MKIDERAGVLFYTARDGDNLLKLQLHRVGLDGKGRRRLTDPGVPPLDRRLHPRARRAARAAGGHAPCGISPDSRYFVDVYQTHDTPPATRLVDAPTGRSSPIVAKSDTATVRRLPA